MKHFVSMTTTLKGVMKGDIDILDLQGGSFHFGCARVHVASNLFGDVGVPHEATWCNVELPIIHGCDQPGATGIVDAAAGLVSLTAVDEEFREKVTEFLSCVRVADAEGRVSYRIGNYHRHEANLALGIGRRVSNTDDRIYTCRGEWSDFASILKEAEEDGTLESLRIAAKANPPFRSVTLTLSPDGEMEETPGPAIEATMAKFVQEQLGWKVDIRDSDDDDDDQPPGPPVEGTESQLPSRADEAVPDDVEQTPHDHDGETDF